MALIDNKITAFTSLIASLPIRPNADGGLTAEELQVYWDESSEELRTALNATLDRLVSAAGAGDLGAVPVTGGVANTVQTILDELRDLVFSKLAESIAYTDAVAEDIVAGQVPDGSLLDVKLSNTAGQIKDVVSGHTTAIGSLNTTTGELVTDVSALETAVSGIDTIVDGLVIAVPTKLAKNADTLESYSEKRMLNAVANGTVDLDLAVQNTFVLTPSGATALNPINVPATGKAVSLTLIINQPASPFAITFPASFKWANDVAPTDLATASKTAVVTAVTVDGGSRWYAFLAGSKFTT